MSAPIGVGLVGYGKAGRGFHEPLIQSVDGLNLTRIVKGRADTAGFEALLADREIAAVVIATPNESHFDLARRSLLAGKHVVVDKPFTVTSDEAQALIDVARDQQRILTVFHNRRWEGDFRTLRRLIDEKALGRVVLYEARFDRFRNAPRPGAWREGSGPGTGILYDLGSHLIDQALVLFGVPRRITADIRTERSFGESDDAFDLWLHYPQIKVSLTAGMLVREPTPRFTIRGTEGTFVKSGLDPQEAALAAGRSPREEGWGREPREQWGTIISDRGEETIETLPGAYQAFYENLRDAIAGRELLIVDPEQARTTIEIIEAAARSSRDRRSVDL